MVANPRALETADVYDRVATYPRGTFAFHCGAAYAQQLLRYDARGLGRLPRLATACFVGVGQPLALHPVEAGQSVLDIGCGTGTDVLLAAERVGPTGRVVGVDLTQRMVDRARTAAAQAGLDQVVFREGSATALPVGDQSINVVLCNGLLHAAADRAATLGEIARVLAPGGRLLLGALVADRAGPAGGWLAHVPSLDTLIDDLGQAGLSDVRRCDRWDPFLGCASEALARSIGAYSVGLVATR